MKISLRGNRVGIEKLKKVNKNQNTGFLFVPEAEEYQGLVRFVGETAAKDLQVGQKVYFSTNFQQVKMVGMDICILEDSQVFAIATEE
jgi:co-chaperonin GroES (HSP10)